MKPALLIGIDHYTGASLSGCVKDAQRLSDLLANNDDGTLNFSCFTLLSSKQSITRSDLRKNVEKLFRVKCEIVLFYFAGHGYIDNLDGYLVTPDSAVYSDGLSMTDLLTLASKSEAREVIIMLDCCHSGAFGMLPNLQHDYALLREGLTVLCACSSSESALESGGSGLFTSLVCEGLQGGASNLIGDVTVASVYAFVERNLGPWQQRPIFRANLSKLEVLRRCDPVVELSALRLLPLYFSTPDAIVSSDSSDEGSEPTGQATQRQRATHFRAYRSAGLIKNSEHGSIGATMGQVLLSSLGRYYWKVTARRLI